MADEGHVNAAVPQILQKLGAEAALGMQLKVDSADIILPEKLLHELWDAAAGQLADAAHENDAAGLTEFLHGADAGVQLQQGAGDGPEKILPVAGQLHIAAVSGKKRYTELGLEMINGIAQGRLTDVQGLGGPTVVLQRGNGFKVTEMVQIHKDSLSK